MLKITLYKKCRLTDKYQEVISTGTKTNGSNSILDIYLNSLEKTIIEIDNTYQELSGQLIFDYELLNNNIYEYNYMKIETIDEDEIKIKRYCFIDNIKLVNELVYIDYKEDIWSSYSNKIKGINKSLLINSRVKRFYDKLPNRLHSIPSFTISYNELPVDLNGNEGLTINSLTNEEVEENNRKATILVEIQFYNSTTYGNSNSRFVSYFVLESDLETTSYEIKFNETNPLFTIEGTILRLLSYQQNSRINVDVFDDQQYAGYRFEVGDIYIIPSNWFIYSAMVKNRAYITDANSSTKVLNLFELKEMIFNFSCVSSFLGNNYKRESIGTYNTKIKSINIGDSINYEVLFNKDRNNLSIKLNTCNELIDITEDFKYDIPIASLTSEQLSQYQISKTLKDQLLQNEMNIDKINATYGSTNALGQGIYSSFKLGNPATVGIRAIGSGISMGGRFKYDQDIYEEQLKGLQAKFDANNAPVYSASSGIFGNNLTLLNAYDGIIETIKSVKNEKYVFDAINNIGYKVYEFLDDINLINFNNPYLMVSWNIFTKETKDINYNVIKFDAISLYGDFPCSIAKMLNSIFETGVKIWYKETFEEDNYINDEELQPNV